MNHVAVIPIPPLTPPDTRPFRFSCFVPALSYNGGLPRVYSKGHLAPRYFNGRIRWVDTDEVYAWVNHIVSHTIAKRDQLIRSGYDPFPYQGPVQVAAIFVVPRPHTVPEGPPAKLSEYLPGDVDGLQKALGDALVKSRTKNAIKYPKANIIADDAAIARWLDPQKAFPDQISWGRVKPAVGVWFRVEAYDPAPIKISRFV